MAEPRKLAFCRDCIYRSGKFDVYGCDYASITGRTRKAHPPGAGCPYKIRGARGNVRKDILLVEPGRDAPLSGGPKRRGRKLNYEKAMDLYRRGMNDKEIGRELQVNFRTVQAWRFRNGLPSNFDHAKQED